MLSHSSTWILIIIHDLVLDNMVDIHLKCSRYQFCHLESSLAQLWYYFLCFPYKCIISYVDIILLGGVLFLFVIIP